MVFVGAKRVLWCKELSMLLDFVMLLTSLVGGTNSCRVRVPECLRHTGTGSIHIPIHLVSSL